MPEIYRNINDCYEWGNREINGKIVKRDLFFYKDGETYTVGVTTPYYLDEIKAQNSKISDPDLQEDDELVTLDDISDVAAICQKLHQMPIEILLPFLGEQSTLSKEDSNNQTDSTFDPR